MCIHAHKEGASCIGILDGIYIKYRMHIVFKSASDKDITWHCCWSDFHFVALVNKVRVIGVSDRH
jgi:hypothetical protein